jgi:hypothetical protein
MTKVYRIGERLLTLKEIESVAIGKEAWFNCDKIYYSVVMEKNGNTSTCYDITKGDFMKLKLKDTTSEACKDLMLKKPYEKLYDTIFGRDIVKICKNKNIIDQLRHTITYKEKLEILKNFQIACDTNLL